MTLTTPYSATFYVGDGETKTFPYLFEEVSESFISVIVYNSLTGQSSTPTYIVDTDQKQVIFGDDTPAPTADETVCIYRNTPNVQDTPFRTLQGYDAKALENILSKIVAMIQEIKSNYFTTQVLQGDPWQLDLLKASDDGATVNIDYTAKKLVKGLYFKITDGNLQVSADDSNYITMPKSVDVAEFRQKEVILPDLSVVYKLEYRVGNTWYDASAIAESKAQQAIEIAEEARDIANEAKEMIQNQIIVRSATIPTASADLVGKAYQYAGTTNALYTHNYIYECVAGETTYTAIIGFDPTKIAFDYTKGEPATFFGEITPNFPQITHGTFTYDIAGNIWTIVGKDSNENVVFDNYRLYTEDLEDAGFVFINPPQDYTDGEVIDYEITFTPQPTTYSWVRVDVQPDRITQIQALQADVTDIQALIPAQASPTNQLGDKDFINSSIATNTANFIGTFNSVAELEAYAGTVTNNDYAFVIGTDSAGNTTYNRYKYNANTQQWIYEYTLNNSSFTAAQWAAINSGVTASDVSKARTAVQPSDVGNGTITITQGGVTKGSFTLNQATGDTIALDAGGGSIDAIDGVTITKNSDDEIQAVATINANTAAGATNPVYDWVGTLAEYNAQNIETLHPDWMCYITDDISGGLSVYTKTQVNNLLAEKANTATTLAGYGITDGYTKSEVDTLLAGKADTADLTALLNEIYPVGSVYIGTQSTCPMGAVISGSTWELVSSGRALWTGNGTNANTTIAAGLPNITGNWGGTFIRQNGNINPYGAATGDVGKASAFSGGSSTSVNNIGFDASHSNSIYGNSTTVQPPAYRVNVWRRTA